MIISYRAYGYQNVNHVHLANFLIGIIPTSLFTCHTVYRVYFFNRSYSARAAAAGPPRVQPRGAAARRARPAADVEVCEGRVLRRAAAAPEQNRAAQQAATADGRIIAMILLPQALLVVAAAANKPHILHVIVDE
eukprot:COSAG01_NODE_4178_length_5265_cov_17.430649_4_plen_135_part_00